MLPEPRPCRRPRCSQAYFQEICEPAQQPRRPIRLRDPVRILRVLRSDIQIMKYPYQVPESRDVRLHRHAAPGRSKQQGNIQRHRTQLLMRRRRPQPRHHLLVAFVYALRSAKDCLNIRLGHILIRELLRLDKNSVLELDQGADEPLDIVVNDSVLARGEVVDIEGRLGIRITDIVSRKERVETLS